MPTGQLIREFDTWRQGYDGAIVTVYIAGTTNKANIFSDEGLTITLPNPQTLDSKNDVNASSYGKFLQSVYTASPYYLDINIGEDTGIQRPPLTTLDAEDASNVTVTVDGSSTPNTLSEIIERRVEVENYGQIITGGAIGSAASNTTTLTAAIGALGGSGLVILPAGVIRVNAFSIPDGVLLVGQGEKATTLQIISGGIGVTLTGDKGGFRDMSLDGNILTTGSVGIYAVNRTAVLFENFTVKNFDKGMTLKGGNNPQWKNFSIVNCNTGGELHGDMDAGGTNLGGSFIGGRWDGGRVAQCSTIGLDLKYVDALVGHNGIDNIFFDSNTGTAVRIKGAQFELLNNCRWDGTGLGINLDISDDTTVLTPTTQYKNKSMGIVCRGGLMNGGSVKVTGNAFDVMLEHMKLLGVAFNLVSTVGNNVILKDCFEDGNTTVTGSASQLVRQFGDEVFEVNGVTTGNAATRAWGITLQDNQNAYFEAKIIGTQRNGTNRAIYHAVCGARRAVATLAYKTQTANYTSGDILTGATSGATGRIVADSDSGTTGTLSLGQVNGEFLDGEIITGSTTGSANADGTLTHGAHALDTVGTVLLRTAYETNANWDVGFAATTGEVKITVTGDTSQTIDWTVHVEMVTG